MMLDRNRSAALVLLTPALLSLFCGNTFAVQYAFTKIADGATPGIARTLGNVALNRNGVVAFDANMPIGTGVFFGTGGPLTKIVDNSYPFSGVRSLAINDVGQVAVMVMGSSGNNFVLRGDGNSIRTMTNGITQLGDYVAINTSGIVACQGDWASGIGVYTTDGVTVRTITNQSQLEARYNTSLSSISANVAINDSGVVSMKVVIGGSRILRSDGTVLTEVDRKSVV
jgi:hypothetical protein